MCAEVCVMLHINVKILFRPQFQRDFILLLPKEVGLLHCAFLMPIKNMCLCYMDMCSIHI